MTSYPDWTRRADGATTPDRVITYASASCGPMQSWLPQEVVGTSVRDYLHPRSRRGRLPARVALLHTEGTTADVVEIEAGRAVVQEMGKRYRRPDGSDVPVVVPRHPRARSARTAGARVRSRPAAAGRQYTLPRC